MPDELPPILPEDLGAETSQGGSLQEYNELDGSALYDLWHKILPDENMAFSATQLQEIADTDYRISVETVDEDSIQLNVKDGPTLTFEVRGETCVVTEIDVYGHIQRNEYDDQFRLTKRAWITRDADERETVYKTEYHYYH